MFLQQKPPILQDFFSLLYSAQEPDVQIATRVLDRCGALVCSGGRSAIMCYLMGTWLVPICQNVVPRMWIRVPMIGYLVYNWKDIYMKGGSMQLYWSCWSMLRDVSKSNATEQFKQKSSNILSKYS